MIRYHTARKGTRVRIESITDHPELIETVARWQWGEWGHLDPADSLAARIAGLRAQAAGGQIPTTYVALEGDAPLGSASVVVADMPTHPELAPWLASVYVTPSARGRGVASALVRCVVEHVAAMGVARLYLYTEGARGLYEKLGWYVIATDHFEGSPVTIMAIDVAPGTMPVRNA
jgi:GNAT superfamily N-acetyltransferase